MGDADEGVTALFDRATILPRLARQGRLQAIGFALAMEPRELEGRETQPTAGVIDSQSVKTTEK